MRVMRLVSKKNVFFQTMFILENTFSQDFVFLLSFIFSKKNFNCVYFTFESCLSLIMTSGSQLKVKTIKYIILIVLAGCFIINIPYHLNTYVI